MLASTVVKLQGLLSDEKYAIVAGLAQRSWRGAGQTREIALRHYVLFVVVPYCGPQGCRYLTLDAPRASGSGERQNLPPPRLLRGLARTGNSVFDFELYKIYGSIPVCYAMRLSCTLHSFDSADTAREQSSLVHLWSITGPGFPANPTLLDRIDAV